MLHGRKQEAEHVLDLILGPEHAEERRELLAVPHVQGNKAGLKDIFAKGVRGRTFLGAFLNVSKKARKYQLFLTALYNRYFSSSRVRALVCTCVRC